LLNTCIQRKWKKSVPQQGKPSGRIRFYFDADYPLKVQREPRLESHSLFQSPFFRKECATQSDPLDEEDAPPSLVIYEVLPLKGAD